MRTNYHTHNALCGHADGTIEEYTLAAIDLGFEILGMSDHIPYPNDDYSHRMPMSEFENYLKQTTEVIEKYSDRIELHRGIEAEFIPRFVPFYESMLRERGIEYMILGVHFFENRNGALISTFDDTLNDEDMMDYAKTCMEAMSTGYYKYLCHPDLFMINEVSLEGAKRATDYIINESLKHDYILELNANGVRRGVRDYSNGTRYPYSSDFFWKEVAKAGIRTIIGSDCHQIERLYDDAVKTSEAIAERLKLNLIDTIVIPYAPR